MIFVAHIQVKCNDYLDKNTSSNENQCFTTKN